MYDLPKSVTICGREFPIETDYRAILDIFAILNDADLSLEEKSIGVLGIFYIDFSTMPQECFEEAFKKCFEFINCGNMETGRKTPKLMDWEQDFQYLVAPINHVAGKEIRAVEYMHWWTFVSYYYEIGDCFFAHIVRIRELKLKGKLTNKDDKEFYRKNREIIDIKTKYSQAQDDIVAQWI